MLFENQYNKSQKKVWFNEIICMDNPGGVMPKVFNRPQRRKILWMGVCKKVFYGASRRIMF